MQLAALTLLLQALAFAEGGLRKQASRIRSSESHLVFPKGNTGTQADILNEQTALGDQEDTIQEMIHLMGEYNVDMSMDTRAPTHSPTRSATVTPTAPPSEETDVPTQEPESFEPTPSPSAVPSVGRRPTDSPSDTPTGSLTPSPSPEPSDIPTLSNSIPPTSFPTGQPSPFPSGTPTTSPNTDSPSQPPSESNQPSSSPTLDTCFMSTQQRENEILELLDSVADPSLIRDPTTPQGRATEWILSGDGRQLCPTDAKLLQRWVLAVVYFSTGGDEWFHCSADDAGCGSVPLFQNRQAFLSPSTECGWAGIACNFEECVTEIEFEENNLAGTIPTEMGLLDELVIWGMERGNLTGTIPSEIGELEELIFIDLDYNNLTGSLPSELYNLEGLTQLDLNNNALTGNIQGIGVFTELEFLQLHTNFFTGTIPVEVGNFYELRTFTLHESMLTGEIPPGLCDLVDAGTLKSLIADCGGTSPEITCDCCTVCRP